MLPRGAARLTHEVALSIVAVAVTTAVLLSVRPFIWLPNFAMVYLVAVLAVAVAAGSRASVFAALGSFVAFNFFFVEPLYSLTVRNPEEWVALLLLLMAGVVTGQLAGLARHRSAEAAAREREAVVLFEVVRLVNELDLRDALAQLAERLRTALDAEAALIRIDDESEPVTGASGDPSAIAAARRAAPGSLRILGGEHGGVSRWVTIRWPVPRVQGTEFDMAAVRIRSEGRDLGRIVVAQRRGAGGFEVAEERLLLAAASQLGRSAEHQALRRTATEADVLRRTDELRSAMVNTVSHDLRTPLASIIAAADSLRARDIEWTDEERDEFARSIATEARRMNQLVGHLLDLSRIEAGAWRIDPQWRDLADFIVDTVARLGPQTAGRCVSVSIPETLPPLQFDEVALGEALANLIENADRHTSPGTAIEVSACAGEGAVTIDVRDHGSGIPSSALGHLFEPFAPGAGDRSRPRGSGVGLAVARGLVEAHGGTISGENDPGGGARFRISLPVRSQAASSDRREEPAL
ncbi:MAG: DUF4118 domain-containing protein [Dehalococcoidia bacterium]